MSKSNRLFFTLRLWVHQLMHELRLTVVMTTGDNEATAQTIAREVAINRVFAEVLPGDQASYLAQLQAEGYFGIWLAMASMTRPCWRRLIWA